MPLAMRDLADAFAARCFLVRAMLLPGHGTRAGDLLDVTREDWLAATRFGLETLKEDVDQVFVGGFSLGGLLAMHAVLEDATVRGAFMFSPALALRRAWLVGQSAWLRHVLDWLDRDAPDGLCALRGDAVNATAETLLLTRELARLLEQRRVDAPVFMAQSADDPVIDVAVNRSYFEQRFSHPGSRLVVYRRDPREETGPGDARVSYRNSFLPEQRIAGFSHQSIHIAPGQYALWNAGRLSKLRPGLRRERRGGGALPGRPASMAWGGGRREPGGDPRRRACGAADLQPALRRTARTGRRVPHGDFVLNRHPATVGRTRIPTEQRPPMCSISSRRSWTPNGCRARRTARRVPGGA